jgi:hypothetical protein
MRIRSSSSDRKNLECPGSPCRPGAAAQLVVDPPALVPLGAQHEQPARRQRLLLQPRHLGADLLRPRVVLARARVFDLGQFLPDAHVGIAAELDVGAAARHVGGDRHRPRHPRLPMM